MTHSQVDLSLRCVGEYPNMCRFIERLEKIPRKSTVTQLIVQHVEGHIDYPFEIRIILYFGLQESDPTDDVT